MAKLDSAMFASVASDCFDLAMDGRLSQVERTTFLQYGNRMRAHWVAIVSEEFNATTELFVQASNELATTNAKIKALIERLDDIAGTVNQLASLVSVVDDLLKLAGGILLQKFQASLNPSLNVDDRD